MTITSPTEMPALQQQRRVPTYFPGNDEDPVDAEPAPSADFSFSDLLDVINPLQHIPIVSSIYRAITGDTISPTANVLGSALFGGPVGALAAGATEMFSEMSGGTPEEHLLAMLDGDPEPASTTSDAIAARPAAPPIEPPSLLAEVPAAPTKNPVAEAPPAPSALFQALQSRPSSPGATAQGIASERTGRDIRAYLAEAGPAARPAPTRTAAPEPATTTDEDEREAMRAAVAAAHARGMEMLRQQAETQSASPPQDLPDWFAERMMQGLAKYRDGSQLGTGATAGHAIAG